MFEIILIGRNLLKFHSNIVYFNDKLILIGLHIMTIHLCCCCYCCYCRCCCCYRRCWLVVIVVLLLLFRCYFTVVVRCYSYFVMVSNLLPTLMFEMFQFISQWYGNQVTCKWWDDIWLNEGFATNYNYFPTEAIGWEGVRGFEEFDCYGFLNYNSKSYPAHSRLSVYYFRISSMRGSPILVDV